MNSISTFLSFACIAAGTVLGGCSTGDGSDDGAAGAPSGAGGGGSGGASGATALFSFDSGTQDFKLNDAKSDDPMYVNLVTPGDVEVPSPAPVLEWASKDYDASAPAGKAGSLKITATYGSWNQSVTAEVNVPPDPSGAPYDFTNRVLRARVFLETGLSDFADAPGGVVFFIKTEPGYAWGQAPWKNLDVKNQWVEVRFDTTAPDSGSKPEFDPANPIQLGFKLDTGGGNMHTAEEYADTLTIAYIDQITVEQKP